jgi:four helix bundle protein
MATSFEDLKVLQAAETIADDTWKLVVLWEAFARETVSAQLVRAVDSIGANIAESFGRFHYGEKLQFLYYARGSLFETKYWVNRALVRKLTAPEHAEEFSTRLAVLARQLNAFASSLRNQRLDDSGQPKARRVQESGSPYDTATATSPSDPLFSTKDLQWIMSTPESSEPPRFQPP